MKQYLFLFIFLSQFSFGDSYKYVGTNISNNKIYINTDPEYLTVYNNGYKFWYKSVNAKNQTVEKAKVTLITSDKTYCPSDFTDANGNTRTFNCDYTPQWPSYSPDSMFAFLQNYLDSIYGKRPNKIND